MDLKKLLFSFDGRINRAKFWLVALITTIISIVAGIIGIAIISSLGTQTGYALYLLINIALSVYTIWAGLASGVKRLHDRAKSGWWLAAYYLVPMVLAGAAGAMDGGTASIALLLAAAVIWIVAFIDLACLRGTIGSNAYGPDPVPAAAD